MDPNQQQKTAGPEPESGQVGFCARIRASIGQPERMQPAILAISLTYLVYTTSALAGYFTVAPAAVQFTYFCAILGLASAIVFYLKFCGENYSTFWLLIYNSILVLIILLYIGHWFVKPQFVEKASNSTGVKIPPGNITGRYFQDADGGSPRATVRPQVNSTKVQDKNQNQTTVRPCTFEKAKCSQPLHLVLQVAFMVLILASLTVNMFA